MLGIIKYGFDQTLTHVLGRRFRGCTPNSVALNALLIAKKPSKEGSKRNNYYHYDVVLDGEMIVPMLGSQL